MPIAPVVAFEPAPDARYEHVLQALAIIRGAGAGPAPTFGDLERSRCFERPWKIVRLTMSIYPPEDYEPIPPGQVLQPEDCGESGAT